jgi:serine/threonine protein phosphatase PrpC
MLEPPHIEVVAISHRGRLRPSNEDSITVAGWVAEREMSAARRSCHKLAGPLLFAVADGMGGHAAGEIASGYAIKRLASGEPFGGGVSDLAPDLGGDLGKDLGRGLENDLRAELAADLSTGLADRLSAINAELYETMRSHRALRGMGTTVAGLLLSRHRAIWFNVGDSRVYLQRNGILRQISIDDVPPGPRTGMITQTLGGAHSLIPIAPHIGEEDLSIPSRWLICSDGVTDLVAAEEIEGALAGSDDKALHALFAAAMDAGGTDNISILIVSAMTSCTARPSNEEPA